MKPDVPTNGDQTQERKRHRRFRALWLAVTGLLLAIAGGLLLRPMFTRIDHDPISRIQCGMSLRQIYLALERYTTANDGHFPPSLSCLLRDREFEPSMLWCSNSDDPIPIGATPEALVASFQSGRTGSYVYVGMGLTRQTTDGDAVLAFEPPRHHRGYSVLGSGILWGDGYTGVESVSSLVQILSKLEMGPGVPSPAKLLDHDAMHLYEARWQPKLSAMRNGTWAASLPHPIERR